MRRIAPLLALLLALSCVFATEPDLPPVLTSLALQPSSASLDAIDRKVKLMPRGADADGQPVVVTTVVWSTSAVDVATVTSDGVVTAVAEGDATITAKYSETVKTTATITVRPSIVFSATPLSGANPVADQTKASATSAITVKAAR